MIMLDGFATFLGGIALLLWGIRTARRAMFSAIGTEVRGHLAKATAHRGIAFGLGLVATLLVQSSTATALMVVAFIRKRILTTAAGLAAILGADVGTALVATVLSLQIPLVWPVLVGGGYIVFAAAQRNRVKELARFAFGLGLVLLALSIIRTAAVFTQQGELLDATIGALAAQPVLLVVLTALLTWLVHSSLAIVLITVSLVGGGMVAAPIGLLLVLGANLGGAIPVVALVWKQPRPDRQVPVGNLVFRLIAVAIALPLVPVIGAALSSLGLSGVQQVLAMHLGLNVAIALVFISLITPAANVLMRVFTEQTNGDDPRLPKHLDPLVADDFELAMSSATREVFRMCDTLENMLEQVPDVLMEPDETVIRAIRAQDDILDSLNEAIQHYLNELAITTKPQADVARLERLLHFATNLEHIGDIIVKNLMRLANKKRKSQVQFSEDGQAEIQQLHGRLLQQFRVATALILTGNVGQAEELRQLKRDFNELRHKGISQHYQRLRSHRPETMETSTLHLDVLRDLKHISSLLASTAYPVLHAAENADI